MANPKKPRQLKIIAGTDRPSRRDPGPTVDFPLVDSTPVPPDWLPNNHAVKEWERLAPLLQANGLLTEAGLSAFGHLCATHGKIVQLHAAGEAPNASLLSTLRNLLNDFGLTPVAQGKVKAAGEVPKGNRFAAHGKR